MERKRIFFRSRSIFISLSKERERERKKETSFFKLQVQEENRKTLRTSYFLFPPQPVIRAILPLVSS